ncbi:malonate decarboxylase subunit epsilon [Variovorax sp. Sphag1AA]|uniref:malonate decarboxylase subunit epsilon n=1 Tax=Variovorax sp. Sphag1AA TaxID=2587027 RepID=UPI0016164AEF|nr:malonate decarboxylase subunit epsilon [Variovorax sp. Sphag1AA]MBB3177000.1 [acyl-carrier-protein] S-malonyltransferase [Variovorax sp. Sphag1AA]
MSYALIFSGQGMQHSAMLPWLTENELLQSVERELGLDWRERLRDPDWAGRNANAQLLLTGLGLAAWTTLAPHLAMPALVAGYSVGEVAAFAAAGVYDAPTAVDLVRHRAELMDRDAQRCACGLIAVSGLGNESIEALCADFGLALAIRNDPVSVVLGGPKATLGTATEAAQRLGAHVTRLNVNVASHTPWMREAAHSFETLLAARSVESPRIPLLSNVAGRIRNADQARAALARQIDHTVRWDECMEGIASRRVRCVLEIGPGQALARMWNERHADIPARSADEFRSVNGVIDWIERHAA